MPSRAQDEVRSHCESNDNGSELGDGKQPGSTSEIERPCCVSAVSCISTDGDERASGGVPLVSRARLKLRCSLLCEGAADKMRSLIGVHRQASGCPSFSASVQSTIRVAGGRKVQPRRQTRGSGFQTRASRTVLDGCPLLAGGGGARRPQSRRSHCALRGVQVPVRVVCQIHQLSDHNQCREGISEAWMLEFRGLFN